MSACRRRAIETKQNKYTHLKFQSLSHPHTHILRMSKKKNIHQRYSMSLSGEKIAKNKLDSRVNKTHNSQKQLKKIT